MMPDIDRRELELTKEERFLLDWLGKSDTSLLGECNGLALDHLINEGLAEIEETYEGKTVDYRYNLVRLTERGQEEARP